MKIAVSFLNSDNPVQTIKKIDDSKADYIHVDFMDNTFVPYKSLSIKELNKYLSYPNKPLFVHLMVNNPLKYLNDFALLKTEYFTFQAEIKADLKQVIKAINEVGLKPGLAINIKTDPTTIFEYLPLIEMVIIMSVEAGQSGQQFNPIVLEKVKTLAEQKAAQNLNFMICLDGGINNETAKIAADLGVDCYAVASYIWQSDDYDAQIASLID